MILAKDNGLCYDTHNMSIAGYYKDLQKLSKGEHSVEEVIEKARLNRINDYMDEGICPNCKSHKTTELGGIFECLACGFCASE